MFPIYVLDGQVSLPKEGTYYVVARGGIYLSKDTGLVRAMVRVDGISFLEEVDTRVTLRVPKIPSCVIALAVLFFRRVYEEYAAEAAVLLYYDARNGAYLLDAPFQQVTGTSVSYQSRGRVDEGLQLVGTIHSHANFEAFHSGVDVHDEQYLDGIHITIGRVDQPYFTVSGSIAVNNNRFPMSPGDIVSGIKEVEYSVPAKGARGYRRPFGVNREGYRSQCSVAGNLMNWLDDVILGPNEPWIPKGQYGQYPYRQQFYDLVFPEGKDYRNYPFPKVWMDRVSKYEYPSPSNGKGVLINGGVQS